MNEIKIYLKPSGSIAELYKDFELYEGCYRNSQLTVFVPKSLLYANEENTFINLIKTGAILAAPNGKKLTTKTYYLDYERDQTIGGVEFRVYTTITPKEFCVYAGTQTVVVNVESIDNTNPDAQTIISVTTTQTADLIVLESAYLGQDEPIDPTELDKIKATLTEIQSEIGGLPNKYVPRSSGRHIVYVNDINGNPSTQIYAVDASGNIIVQRDKNGQIKVPLAPAQDDDAVSKKYVDDADNTKLNKVEPFANGTYAYTVSKSDVFGTTNGYTEISETDKIKTIAKRKANGCIETRTPYADVEAANKGYVDTAISDTQNQLAQTNQNVEDLYTILEQAQVVTVTTLEQAYTARETADGENIVDGVRTAVKEIRGKTVATENLIPYPYTETTKTANGVTFTVNSDGSVTVNGTATSDADFMLLRGPIQSYSESYFLSGCPTGGSDTTYYISESFTMSKDTGNGVVLNNLPSDQAWRIVIKSGTTVNNLVFRPMLNAGTTAKPYSKWFAGLKNARFKGITSTGKNLFDPSTFPNGTVNGIAVTIETDGIRLNGTATKKITLYGKKAVSLINYLAGKQTYFYSENNQNVRIEYSILYADGTKSSYPRTDLPRSTLPNKIAVSATPVLIIENGMTFNNQLFKVALYKADSATAYEPYISDTLSAETPIELAEYDVAYPETGKTKRQSKTVTFNGTEAWVIDPNYTAFSLELPSKGIAFTSICSPYSAPKITAWDQLKDYEAQNDVRVLLIKDSTYSTVEAWKAHLAELAAAGNPLTVTYKTVEATTEATPFNKSKYKAWKNGSETIEQGPTDNSEYGAENTVKQDYFTLTGGTTNV